MKVSWNASCLDADPSTGIFELPRVPQRAGLDRGLCGEACDHDGQRRRSGRRSARDAARRYGNGVSRHPGGGGALDTVQPRLRHASDSIAGSNPRTYFMVEARSSTAGVCTALVLGARLRLFRGQPRTRRARRSQANSSPAPRGCTGTGTPSGPRRLSRWTAARTCRSRRRPAEPLVTIRRLRAPWTSRAPLRLQGHRGGHPVPVMPVAT